SCSRPSAASSSRIQVGARRVGAAAPSPARGPPFTPEFLIGRAGRGGTRLLKYPEWGADPRNSGDLCYIRGGLTGHGGLTDVVSRVSNTSCELQRKSEEDIEV